MNNSINLFDLKDSYLKAKRQLQKLHDPKLDSLILEIQNKIENINNLLAHGIS